VDARHRDQTTVHDRFDGFEAHFAAEIEPWLLQQESRRKRFLRWAGMAIAITIAIVIPLQFLYWGLLGDDIAVGAIFLLVPAFMGGAIAWAIVWLFRSSIKQFLVPKVCEYAGLTYTEHPSSFAFHLFDEADFLPAHDRKLWEDGIGGDHAGVSFQLVEARLQTRHRSDNGGDSWRTKWRGLMLLLEFPKRFQGLTVVTRERSAWRKLFGGEPGAPVKLEDPTFESMFEVFSTDQVEARYLLTPSFMESVVSLAHLAGKSAPELVFNGDRLGIVIKSKKDRFEAGSIFTPMHDRRRIDELVEELSLIFRCIDALQINMATRT